MKWHAPLAAVTFLAHAARAEDILRSTSLNACQDNSQFTASLLNIFYTPQNNSAYVHLIGVSSIEGFAVFDITITVYGYDFLHKTIDPCQIGLPGLCPMVAAKTDSPPFNVPVSSDAESQIPGIAYTFPDLDAKVRVSINMTSGDQAGHAAACLELDVSNGKTVDLVGIQWASALVILAALIASAVISQLGHFNAASHVIVHTLALFSYFQAQAMIGLCGMPLPPIVQAWTQDFQWSLGLIKLGFMQTVLTWYQRTTGGTPSRLFDTLSDVSVAVHKTKRDGLSPRGVIHNDSGSYVVFGIQRAAFRAGIEPTNAFLTVIGFFTAMMVAAALSVLLAKGACELAVRARWIGGRSERTLEFRNGWHTILKGVLFRCLLAAYPAVAIFCFYEFTQADSAAEVVDAVVYLLMSSLALGYGTYTVIRIASRSIGLHRNPAYILFSDPRTLNKWGSLYVQFRASAYYFVAPVLAHTLLKAIFIAFAQRSGTAQAIGLIVIEATALAGSIYVRPWMDKSTNSFNITICVVNFINAIILLIFSNVFKQPALGTGIVGLIFWVLNAAVTLILLLMIIITTVVIFFRNNPDSRYQYMADDRTSFVKSQVQLASNELDALALTARSVTPANIYPGAVVPGAAASSVSPDARNNNPGLGGGPRDRLLMRDDADETESIVSEFRNPLTAYSSLQQQQMQQQRRRQSPAPFSAAGAVMARESAQRIASPAPSSLVREVGAAAGASPAPGSQSASRNTYHDQNGDRGGSVDRNGLPRSPATPSAPMLPLEERNILRGQGTPENRGDRLAFGGMASPGSPVYGFGSGGAGGFSQSARNTPTPSAQQRALTQQNPASLSSPNLPTTSGYRQVNNGSPGLSRLQDSASPGPWKRGVGYERE